MVCSRYGYKISEPNRGGKNSSVNVFALSLISVSFAIGANASSLDCAPKLKLSDTASLSCDYNDSFWEKNNMLNRLSTLRYNLCEGWDGRSGLPMEEESYNNTLSAIMSLSGRILAYWNLFPCPNGTFLLTTKDNKASINIGNRDFSYVAYCNTENQIKGISPYNNEIFIKVVDYINNILGYEA